MEALNCVESAFRRCFKGLEKRPGIQAYSSFKKGPYLPPFDNFWGLLEAFLKKSLELRRVYKALLKMQIFEVGLK